MQNYKGFSNYATWNVAWWIQNDASFKLVALNSDNYAKFVNTISSFDDSSLSKYNPDGISWNDHTLNIVELNQIINELFI